MRRACGRILTPPAGVIFAERAMMLLGEKLGRDVAHKLLDEATRQSVAQKRHLDEVLAEMPEVSSSPRPRDFAGD